MAAPRHDEIQDWARQYGFDPYVVYAIAATKGKLPTAEEVANWLYYGGQAAKNWTGQTSDALGRTLTVRDIAAFSTATGLDPTQADASRYLATMLAYNNGATAPAGWNYRGAGVAPASFGSNAPLATTATITGTASGAVGQIVDFAQANPLVAAGVGIAVFAFISGGLKIRL